MSDIDYENQVSDISIRYKVSDSIKYQVLDIKYQITSTIYQVVGLEYQISTITCRLSDIKYHKYKV